MWWHYWLLGVWWYCWLWKTHLLWPCTMYFYISFLGLPSLFYLQEMEQMGVTAWLLGILLICKDLLCGQYTITLDPHTALILGICAVPFIFEPLNQILLIIATYKLTSYINFTSLLHSFSMFEAILITFTNDVNSPGVLACLPEADTACIVCRRTNVLKWPQLF